jgi:hypothetical protein
MEIPIRYQGQQPRKEQFRYQQPEEPSLGESIKEKFGQLKEGITGGGVSGSRYGGQPWQREQREQGWQQQQPSRFGREEVSPYGRGQVQPGYEEQGRFGGGVQEQQYQQPSRFKREEVSEQEQPRTFGEKVSSMIGGITGKGKHEVAGNIGQWVDIDVKGEFSTSDLSMLHCALQLEGLNYVRNHMLCLLSGDRSGMIKSWQQNVTKKNLDCLIDLTHEAGLTLPFPVKLEEREQEIKSRLRNLSGPVLTDGEVCMILAIGAIHAQQLYSTGFMTAQNPHFRDLCREGCANVTNEYLNVIKCFEKTDNFYPQACVRTVTNRVGVVERK